MPVKTTQTGFPRSAARSISPPPTLGAVSVGAGRPTSGNGETLPLAAGVGSGRVPAPRRRRRRGGDAVAWVGRRRAGDGDSAGERLEPASRRRRRWATRTSGVGVAARRYAPRPTAAPIPTTSPRTTAMKVRMGEERTAWARAPRAPGGGWTRSGRSPRRGAPGWRGPSAGTRPGRNAPDGPSDLAASMTISNAADRRLGLAVASCRPSSRRPASACWARACSPTGRRAQATAPSPSPAASLRAQRLPDAPPVSDPGRVGRRLGRPHAPPGAGPGRIGWPVGCRVAPRRLRGLATRVVVPALKIDLPMVRPPDDPNHFPYCNVAEYRRRR